MAGLPKPKVEERPVPIIDTGSFARLIKHREQDRRQNGFLSKRDLAVLWLLWDSGIRGGELIAIQIHDVDLQGCLVEVVGKSDSRVVPVTSSSGRAIDRYLRVREAHRFSHLDPLWISKCGPMTLSSLRRAISDRAVCAGIGHVYSHQVRHTAADRLLNLGLSEREVIANVQTKCRHIVLFMDTTWRVRVASRWRSTGTER